MHFQYKIYISFCFVHNNLPGFLEDSPKDVPYWSWKFTFSGFFNGTL